MQKLSILTAMPLLAAVTLSTSHSANAADFTGAWASNVSECSKIFQKSGKKISFRADSDLYGTGFIIEKDKIRGKVASCAIKSRKQVSNTIHFIAACSTDVALSTVQLIFKIQDDNNIVRVYPGVEELNVNYGRCP